MSAAAQSNLLPDGQRLHLHHGPIDLIIDADSPLRTTLYTRATLRFQSILSGLAEELSNLRQPLAPNSCFADPVARRMQDAVAPFSDVFVTPMAAVAGAVADEILAAMSLGPDVPKVYVNNGGDIAFHLSDGATMRCVSPAGGLEVTPEMPVRGVATSGWDGRSHSFGIADAVTVLARSAAAADVAATLIANAVDLPGHPAIRRLPANALSPDSDLADRAVTTSVGDLSFSEISQALQRGVTRASHLRDRGLIEGAALCLKGEVRCVPEQLKERMPDA